MDLFKRVWVPLFAVQLEFHLQLTSDEVAVLSEPHDVYRDRCYNTCPRVRRNTSAQRYFCRFCPEQVDCLMLLCNYLLRPQRTLDESRRANESRGRVRHITLWPAVISDQLPLLWPLQSDPRSLIVRTLLYSLRRSQFSLWFEYLCHVLLGTVASFRHWLFESVNLWKKHWKCIFVRPKSLRFRMASAVEQLLSF